MLRFPPQVSESAVLSRLHHSFAAWMGYTFGYKEGLNAPPTGSAGSTAGSPGRSRLLAVQTQLATEHSSRRRGALVNNMRVSKALNHHA